jgi:hypothetical protein
VLAAGVEHAKSAHAGGDESAIRSRRRRWSDRQAHPQLADQEPKSVRGCLAFAFRQEKGTATWGATAKELTPTRLAEATVR